MNIRPFHHLDSSWLNAGTPCGGSLCECDLDRACLNKTPVKFEREHIEGADSIMEWDWPQTHIVDRLQEQHDPVEAPAAPFIFPLEAILTRHPWLGPVLVTCVVVVWTCIDAYLESTP